MLTSKSVVQHVRQLLLHSPLASALSGGVYEEGMRPRNSQGEDISIVFTAGTAEEIPSGVVTLLIFVPDLHTESGVRVEDGRRIAQIQHLAAEWVETLTAAESDYLWRLDRMISAHPDPEIHQHFVSIALRFRHFSSTSASKQA